jgi:nitric oxide reductase NorQ protein
VATGTDELQVGALIGGGNGDFSTASDEVEFDVSARPAFVETPFVKGILDRALAYAGQGFPVHFRGPTGCGKTTLAIHLAEQLGRSMIIVSGDEEYLTSDLVGGEHGYERTRTVDNFIHSVVKMEERVDYRWVDSRLTVACQKGYTLIYDEFNRSRPEANNIFLPVLGERVLILPTIRNQKGYLRVHPDFTAIFTSNPKEYAGVHASQDALLDRMITLDLEHFDRDTEVAITSSRTSLPLGRAKIVVDLVRKLREATGGQCDPTVRACIMIGNVMAAQSKNGRGLSFEQVCLDVLAKQMSPGGKPDAERKQVLLGLIRASRWS